MIPRIMYIERKAGEVTGEARIGRVTFSKTGKTLFYNGKTFQSLKGTDINPNFREVESGDDYWITGCKRIGSNGIDGEQIPIEIDEDIREEYWTDIRKLPQNKDQTRV